MADEALTLTKDFFSIAIYTTTAVKQNATHLQQKTNNTVLIKSSTSNLLDGAKIKAKSKS